MKKAVILSSLMISSGLFWLVHFRYPNPYVRNVFYTVLTLTILYFLFRIAFEVVVAKRIRESKTRYSFRKTVSILYLVMSVAIMLRIWVEDAHMLTVSYGLVGAGIAVAL